MTAPETIVCKPTPWFLLRAAVMLVMFGVFAVLFYMDGATGYRNKNESFYLNKTFQTASKRFEEMNKSGDLTPAEWQRFADSQTVSFPEDRSVLPTDLVLPMPWPAILHDFDKMKPLQWNLLWRDYTLQRGMDSEVVEEPFDAKKIREQWIVFAICALLAAIAAFFLIRTLGRAISVDDGAVTTQRGKRIPFTDLKTLDLRKWETKGLAFIAYDGAAGKGRIRIDGLTYGGFKKDNGEPAERLMQRIRKCFSGEIIEYAAVVPAESADVGDKPA